MNSKIVLLTFSLFCVNAYSQADTTINMTSVSVINFIDSASVQNKIDSIVFPRNIFSEIDFSYFKTNTNTKSVLKYIQPKKGNSKHYFFAILCFLAMTVVYIRYQYQKELNQIIKSAFGINNSIEKDISINKLLLSLNYMITSILLLYFFIKLSNFKFKFTDETLMMIVTVTFVGLAVSRYILLKFLGIIFELQELFSNYQTTNDYINYVTGIILLPILFSEIYSHSKISHILLYIGFFIVLINILYKIIKNILLHTQLMVYNIFHFIIYFCAVEIFPYLILNKFFREQIF